MSTTLFCQRPPKLSQFKHMAIGQPFYSARDDGALWVKTDAEHAIVIGGTAAWPLHLHDAFDADEVVRAEHAISKLTNARSLYQRFRTEHPTFGREVWLRRAAEGKTDLGYWEWAESCDAVRHENHFQHWLADLKQLTHRECESAVLVALFQDGFSPDEAKTYLTMEM